MQRYTVYSKPACPFCDQAKSLLEAKGLQYDVINLDVGQPKVEGQKYISREDLLTKIPTARTMPQIFMEDTDVAIHIGGFTELKKSLHA
jgi:glutaredoxin 3